MDVFDISYYPHTHFNTKYIRLNSTMKTFQIVTLFALVAASMAFSPNQGKFQVSRTAWTTSDV